MIISEKWIAIIWELKFSETLKNLEIYLSLIDWLYQYIFYYVQLTESLQNKKMTLLYKNSIAEKSWKKYFKKTWIDESSVLEHETFEDIQKIFDKVNFLHHQDSNCQLYVDLDVSKQFEFSIMIYHMQDDKNEFLDHIIKKNYSKIQLILFLSKLLTDAETCYWFTELEIICLVWTIKKICHMINRSLADTVVWTDHFFSMFILSIIFLDFILKFWKHLYHDSVVDKNLIKHIILCKQSEFDYLIKKSWQSIENFV